MEEKEMLITLLIIIHYIEVWDCTLPHIMDNFTCQFKIIKIILTKGYSEENMKWFLLAFGGS